MNELKARDILKMGVIQKMQSYTDVTGRRKFCEVVWRTPVPGGWGLRWFVVQEYARGLIRLRTDFLVLVSKSFWPFRLPEMPHMELTFHESEINEELGAKMADLCENVALDREVTPWPEFVKGSSFPHYAWTQKADEFEKQRRARSKRQKA
jgi:hypothetical protein